MRKVMISKRGRIDMKRSRRVTAVLSAILIAACLSGCLGFPGSVSGGSGTGATQAQAAEQNTVTDPEAAKWVDSDIWQVAMAHLDTELKDDFYLAVNSDWISSNRLPDGYASYDTMTECKLEMDQKLAELLKGTEISGDPAVAHDQELVRRYYRMWMNWDQRNDLGVEPLRELLEPLMNVSTLDELTAYLSRPQTVISATELCRCEASIDWNNAAYYTVYIMPVDLIFGDSSYYRMMTEDDAMNEPYYDTVIRHLLVEIGYSYEEATKILKGCFTFEKDIAKYIMTTEEESSRDAVDKENNPRTMKELEAEAGDFPIREILKAHGADGSKSYILTQPDWLDAMDVLYTEEYMEYLKDYLICYTAQDYATLLDRDSYDIYYEVINGISGASGTISDEQAATDAVNTFLPMQMSRVYAERYVPDETKEKVTDLTREIIDAYREMLTEETFLTEATRKEAVNKLDHLTLRIAKPDEWEDDSRLDFDSSEMGGNLLRAQDQVGAFWVERLRSRVGKKVDRDLWTTKVQQVNAFYDPSQNAITICGGILGGNLYNKDMSREELFATVGDTLGHEISHAFDTTGCKFDEYGNIRNWWTQEDLKAFSARADKLVDYYDRIEPVENVHILGSQIEGEAIADLVGMKILLRIAKEDRNFDYETFFKTFASTWRTMTTIQAEYHILMQDTHPLPYLRVNAVVQQFDEFYETFGIEPGDGMYLTPAARLEVW